MSASGESCSEKVVLDFESMFLRVSADKSKTNMFMMFMSTSWPLSECIYRANGTDKSQEASLLFLKARLISD